MSEEPDSLMSSLSKGFRGASGKGRRRVPKSADVSSLMPSIGSGAGMDEMEDVLMLGDGAWQKTLLHKNEDLDFADFCLEHGK